MYCTRSSPGSATGVLQVSLVDPNTSLPTERFADLACIAGRAAYGYVPTQRLIGAVCEGEPFSTRATLHSSGAFDLELRYPPTLTSG